MDDYNNELGYEDILNMDVSKQKYLTLLES